MAKLRWLIVAAALAQVNVPPAAHKSQDRRSGRQLPGWPGRHASRVFSGATCTRRERQAVDGDVL